MISKAKLNWRHFCLHSRNEKEYKNYYNQLYATRLGNMNSVGKSGGQSLLKKKQTKFQITWAVVFLHN